MGELNAENFSVMNYLKIFFRRKELLIIPAFLGLAIGISVGFVLPKEYRSSSVILVEEGKTDNPLFSKLAVSTTVSQRLATIKESMLGWNSLVKLVDRLNLDKDVKTTKQFEHLIMGIREHIIIKLKSDNVLYLAYVGFDPVETQAVVQNITDIFVERNKEIQSQETADAIVFIEKQLKLYRGKIKSAEIAKMQDQLDEMLADSTEKHPIVKQLREKIDNKKAELKRENLQYTEPERLKLESNNPLIESIQGALDTIGTKVEEGKAIGGDDLYKLMLLDRLGTVTARDAAVNNEIYNMLLQRLETAKITQSLQSSKEGTKYTVIDPPRIPLSPFKPNRALVALMGLVMGSILGFCAIVATEFLDKSFLDVEEAKEFLGVPLLGAISRINTEATIRQERYKERWMYSLTFVAGITLVAVTITLSNLLK